MNNELLIEAILNLNQGTVSPGRINEVMQIYKNTIGNKKNWIRKASVMQMHNGDSKLQSLCAKVIPLLPWKGISVK